MTPKHTHDCTNCRFLGTYEGVDHYACHATDGTRRVTLLRRYSSEGPDYDSFPCYAGLPSEHAALLNMPSKWTLTLRLARAYEAGFQKGIFAGVEIACEAEPGCPDCEGEGRVWNNADRTSGQWVPCTCPAGDDVAGEGC
jgi:hypothetical protein